MDEIVEDGHLVFRMVIHPFAFRGKAFEMEKMVCLFKEANNTLVTSVAWQRFLPSEDFLHAYGCRLAARMNQDIIKKKGALKESNRRVYCGSYQLTAESVRALVGTDGLNEVIGAELVHEIENDEIAHVNLKVILRPDLEFDIASTITAIADRLWHTCRGPLRHICDCDNDLTPHPFMTLPVAPSGETTFFTVGQSSG